MVKRSQNHGNKLTQARERANPSLRAGARTARPTTPRWNPSARWWEPESAYEQRPLMLDELERLRKQLSIPAPMEDTTPSHKDDTVKRPLFAPDEQKQLDEWTHLSGAMPEPLGPYTPRGVEFLHLFGCNTARDSARERAGVTRDHVDPDELTDTRATLYATMVPASIHAGDVSPQLHPLVAFEWDGLPNPADPGSMQRYWMLRNLENASDLSCPCCSERPRLEIVALPPKETTSDATSTDPEGYATRAELEALERRVVALDASINAMRNAVEGRVDTGLRDSISREVKNLHERFAHVDQKIDKVINDEDDQRALDKRQREKEHEVLEFERKKERDRMMDLARAVDDATRATTSNREQLDRLVDLLHRKGVLQRAQPLPTEGWIARARPGPTVRTGAEAALAGAVADESTPDEQSDEASPGTASEDVMRQRVALARERLAETAARAAGGAAARAAVAAITGNFQHTPESVIAMRNQLDTLVAAHVISSEERDRIMVATTLTERPRANALSTAPESILIHRGADGQWRVNGAAPTTTHSVQTQESTMTTPKDETNTKSTLAKVGDELKSNATDAAWRTAGKQVTLLSADSIAALLSRQIDPKDKKLKAKLETFLATPLGQALLAGGMSLALEAAPQMGKIPTKRLARELRVQAMAEGGNLLAEAVMAPVRQLLTAGILAGLPEDDEATEEKTGVRVAADATASDNDTVVELRPGATTEKAGGR